jgi:hypothetical protein
MFLGGEKQKLFTTIFADIYLLQQMVGASISVWCRPGLLPNMKPKTGLVFKDHAALEQNREK